MLVSMATGTGKTVVFSKLYQSLKSRLSGQMLVLAHREELVDQSIDKLKKCNPKATVAKEMAEHHADANADIIVASVASLGRKGTKRVEKYDWKNVDKLIVDEAHHSTADSYGNVFDVFGSMLPGTDKITLGFTATPQRSDGKALAEKYEKIAYVYSIRNAIEDGWLADVRGYRVRTETSLADVKTVGGDFAQDQLNETVNTPKRNHHIVESWKELANGRQTVAFCVGIKHAQDLAEMFNEKGIVAEAVWGDDPDRGNKLAQHREGKITVLCNCGVLVEGYDDPSITCVLLARPTKSAVLFTQMVGRGTRLYPGKTDCIVIDVVDISGKHSLVTLPTLMGLQGVLDLKGHSLLWAVKTLEAEQDAHPSIDFTKLESLDKLKQFIEQVDMFDVRFPEEVEENSDLTWYRAAEGGYRMRVPACKKHGEIVTKGGTVHIYQNMLDKWEIVGKIAGAQFHGVRNSMEEAFKVADEQVIKRARYALNVLQRELTWQDRPATPQQLGLLKKLFPWKQFPETLGRGQASRIIGERLAGKAK